MSLLEGPVRSWLPPILFAAALVIWCAPVLRGHTRLSRGSLWALWAVAVAALVYFTVIWPRPPSFPGPSAFLLLGAANVAAGFALIAVWRRNDSAPSASTAILFRAGLMVWIWAWVARWLGETS